MYTQKLLEFSVTYGPKVIGAIAVLIIGWWVIGRIVKGLKAVMTSRNMDAGLVSFLSSLLGAVLKVLLVISVASIVGIETTSFVAVIGAAGFAVGLALQGSLANFAGGALIMIFKPYRVGDFIEAQGYSGIVQEIQIFVTILTTVDNKTIIIPNGPLAGGSMINYSTQDKRRVDMTFGIGYNDDIKLAKDTLEQLLQDDPRVLDHEGNLVAVSELADSSVNFVVRAWVDAGDYWGVFFDMQEKVKLTFDQKGLSIPYPQQDVHMHSVNTAA
ncbi:MAG: mechanosensitive ion channel [Cellvibrionaceae bacterium]|nr:mechanosensitive ion channel [Cellvibrionaceae bacterium]